MSTPRQQQPYIRMLRKRAGLTQRDLAFLLGYRNSSPISRFEIGTRTPQCDELLMLELVFGVTSRLVFPELYEKVALCMTARIKQWQQRHRERPQRMAASTASYKAVQMDRILGSIRHRMAAHLTDRKSWLTRFAGPSAAEASEF